MNPDFSGFRVLTYLLFASSTMPIMSFAALSLSFPSVNNTETGALMGLETMLSNVVSLPYGSGVIDIV